MNLALTEFIPENKPAVRMGFFFGILAILLGTASIFNHSNVRIPRARDHRIRRIVVTTDMHRVHHSAQDHETNSTFGFNLSWWDRLFGTHRERPEHGQRKMTIGICEFRQTRQADRLRRMPAIPITDKMTGYVINRRRWISSK